MTLTEIYKERRDIRDSEIPNKWKESFEKFMYGQTHTSNIFDGKEEYVYYASDFSIWYNRNRLAIERDDKIEEIMNAIENCTLSKNYFLDEDNSWINLITWSHKELYYKCHNCSIDELAYVIKQVTGNFTLTIDFYDDCMSYVTIKSKDNEATD